ncbi:MAG: hypothetical protein GX434_15545 [Peptococcaceae bacterium]|nr:hypothetical protein [Peptococcaceae bacterium]
MLNSELENKQENKQGSKQGSKQESINPGTESKGRKKNKMSTIFLWTVYALTILFIILVVCDNWKS